MGRWEMVRLGDVANITMGQSPPSDVYNDTGEGLAFFQGKADFGLEHPTARIFCSVPQKIANINDVLISVRAPVGTVNIAIEMCCIGRGLAAITGASALYYKYLFYYLVFKEREISELGVGSTFKAINRKDINTISIPLPPLEIQQQIADVLDRASALIEKRKVQIGKLDLLVKSQFVEMFGDLKLNDKHWKIKRLDEIATTRLGKMLDGKKNTGENTFPYLANFNVQWFRFDLDKLNMMDFNEADRTEFALQYGDLLVCEGGEVGRSAIWKNDLENCFFQKAIHRVRCNPDICIPEYLAWVMHHKATETNFDGLVTSATIAHLTGIKLRSMKIPVPPLDLQNRFADFVEAADKSKFEMREQLAKLEILYKSLMQKCLRGEIV